MSFLSSSSLKTYIEITATQRMLVSKKAKYSLYAGQLGEAFRRPFVTPADLQTEIIELMAISQELAIVRRLMTQARRVHNRPSNYEHEPSLAVRN